MKVRLLLLIALPGLLLVSTLGIWILEYVITGDQGSAFNNLFSSLWWTVVTITTVGYGDMSPVTPAGQLFSFLVMAGGIVQMSIIISLVSNLFYSFRGTKERGLDEVKMQNHVLICSDDVVFIREILEENRQFVRQNRVALVCPFSEHPLLTDTQFKKIPWVSGNGYRNDILRKASAKHAYIAYVSYSDDSQALMTVMQIESLTIGDAITMAQYIGQEKRQHFEEVGCDHAMDPYTLYVPMMVSAYRSQGTPWWILQLILRGSESQYGSRVQKSDTPTLENHPLPEDVIGKSWLDYIEKMKRHKGLLPMGLVEDTSVMVNPESELMLTEKHRVLIQVPATDRPEGDGLDDAIAFPGSEDIAPHGHIVISSDNRYFIERLLLELSYLSNDEEVVVVSELELLDSIPESLRVEWIQAVSYSAESFARARATEAKVAFVDHLHDGLTLMAVLEMEQSTGGTIFTIASYRETDFDQQLERAGCDFSISANELTAPVLSQTAVHPGAGVLIERVISGEPSSESLFSRKLSPKWQASPWVDTIVHMKKTLSHLPVALIRGENGRMLLNPRNDVLVAAGDTLLFMARTDQPIEDDVYLPHFLGVLRKPEAAGLKEGMEFEEMEKTDADELFRKGVMVTKQKGEPMEAYRLFLESAIKGNARAKYNLGIMNFHGQGVPRNVDEAYYWFRAAAVDGNDGAQKALKSIKVLRESEAQFRESDKQLNMVLMDHLNEDQKFWYAKAITQMIMADERIDLYERTYLHGAIHILENPEHVRQLEEAILLGSKIEPGNVFGLSDEDKNRILRELTDIATVDRDFDPQEQTLLRELGRAMGSPESVVENEIQRGLDQVKQFQKR